MMNLNHILLIALLCISWMKMSFQNMISLAQGRLSGIAQDGYVSYVGIPYASASGIFGRFKGPGLAPVWSGIRQSHDRHCTSSSPVDDCLQLDVHVPASGSQLPVMVWIKGGSGQYYPGKLVAQGIIVVVVRHRLGPVGFLCSKESKILGNAGIKDALQALRWVRDNIIAFNGNPHKVVVAGQSFGAAMVEALMLSPSSRELYHGVILQSGSILCPWAFNYDAEERANALRQLINGSEEVTSIIKTNTISLGIQAEKIDFPYMPFGMCVEKPYKNEESMILEPPYSLLSKGKMMPVPVLMGYNTNEAYVFTSMLKDAKVTHKLARDMTLLVPEELQYLSERELIQITRQIKDMYFSNNINMSAMLSYHRDVYFISHIHRSLGFHTTMNRPVFYYQFSYSGDIGVVPEPGLAKTGAAHSDELAYLFPQYGKDLEDDDSIVQQHLIGLWTNFVKHLSPTPEIGSNIKWEPTGKQHPRILDINTELQMKEFPHTKATQLWENIYEKYYYTRNLNMLAN